MKEDVISIVDDLDHGDIMRCAVFCDKFKGSGDGMGTAEGIRKDETVSRAWVEAALPVLTMTLRPEETSGCRGLELMDEGDMPG